mmetsp:Transcript_19433/g.32334  ORF Transcript_19433/g.32334 Transcript_19433/m.32334 type:complete len:83 (-) Transcript_19433:2255-2503(-)
MLHSLESCPRVLFGTDVSIRKMVCLSPPNPSLKYLLDPTLESAYYYVFFAYSFISWHHLLLLLMGGHLYCYESKRELCLLLM